MKTRLLLAAAVIALVAPAKAAGLPYSALYTFGDSLSDVGNLFLLSQNPAYGIPHQPLYPYSNGRFSNGAVWVQDLAAGLGLPPVAPSLAGGGDYAFGGAATGTTDAHTATLIDLPTQVASFGAYLAAHPTVDPGAALFTLSIGANDMFALFKDIEGGVPVNPVNVIAEAAANVATAANELRLDGAKSLLLFDLPNLGLTPLFNTSPYQTEATNAASLFNTLVQQDLASVEAAGLAVTSLDTFDLLTAAIALPGSYGFTNAADPCWTGTDTGGPSSGTLCSATFAGQNQYLFWDDVHPTAAGHLLVANDALEKLGFPPLSAPVPEPSSWAMLLVGFAGLGVFGARRVRAA